MFLVQTCYCVCVGKILLLTYLSEVLNSIYIGHTSDDADGNAGTFGDLFASFQKGALPYFALLESIYHLFCLWIQISNPIELKWHYLRQEWDNKISERTSPALNSKEGTVVRVLKSKQCFDRWKSTLWHV